MRINTVAHAQQILSRYLPPNVGATLVPEAGQAVAAAQEVIIRQLRAGDVRVARWVVATALSAARNQEERPGYWGQIAPLVPALVTCVRSDARLAASVLELARWVDAELYQAACASAHNGLIAVA
jgi:hypothetical protein